MTKPTSDAVEDLIFAMEKDIRDAVSLMQALRRSSVPPEGERGKFRELVPDSHVCGSRQGVGPSPGPRGD